MEKDIKDAARPDHNREGGFSALLVVFILATGFLALKLVNDRTVQEMKALASQSLIIDRLKAKSLIRSNFDCASYDFTQSCTLGEEIALTDTYDAVFVKKDGSTRAGEWNIKVECKNAAHPEPIVLLARLDEKGQYRKDPLTGKVQDWSNLTTLKSFCEESTNDSLLLKSSPPCYGLTEGMGALPSLLASGCGSFCAYAYCMDEQRDFPACPSGYHIASTYIDRFGWGGIDFTKYSICLKDAAP